MILFSLLAAIGVGAVSVLSLSGEASDARWIGSLIGVSLLGLPALQGWMRWNRALGVTLVVFAVWFFGVTSIQALGRSTGAKDSLPYFEVRALVGALLALLFLLGGVRILRDARVLRMSDPGIAPVVRRPVRDFVVIAVCISIGVILALRVRDRAREYQELRSQNACIMNLRAVAAALREYETAHGARPPSLELLVANGRLRADALNCPRSPTANGQTYPYQYFPDAGGGPRDLVVCDTDDPHQSAGPSVILGDGTVGYMERAVLDQWLALARLRASRSRMADSLERGELPSVADRVSTLDELNGLTAGFTGVQKSDMTALAEVVTAIQKEQMEKSTAYERALGRFEEAGSIKASTLESRESISARLQLLDDVRDAADAVAAMGKTLNARMVSSLGDERIRRDPCRAALTAAARNAELGMAVNVAERELLEQFESVLRLLDKTWGDWRFDETLEMVVFTSDERTAEYKAIFARIDEIGNRQKEATKRLADELRKSRAQDRP